MAMADRGLSQAFSQGMERGMRQQQFEAEIDLRKKSGAREERRVDIAESAEERTQDTADRERAAQKEKKEIAEQFGDDPVAHSKELTRKGHSKEAADVLNTSINSIKVQQAQIDSTNQAIYTGLNMAKAGDMQGAMDAINSVSSQEEQVNSIEPTANPNEFFVRSEDNPSGRVVDIDKFRETLVSATERAKIDGRLQEKRIAAQATSALKADELYITGHGIVKRSTLHKEYETYVEQEYGLMIDPQKQFKLKLIDADRLAIEQAKWDAVRGKVPSVHDYAWDTYRVDMGEKPPAAGAQRGYRPDGTQGWFVRKGGKTYEVGK